jgi:hypothetical protein
MIPTVVTPKEWASQSELLAMLATEKSRSVLLGRSAEAPRAFYCFSVDLDDGRREIAVVSSGLGSIPAAVLLPRRRLLVAHDLTLTWIDLQAMQIEGSQSLGGVFAEFISVYRDDEVVVLHELGVLRVTADGRVVWSVDTDIVEDVTRDGDNLTLFLMDAPPKNRAPNVRSCPPSIICGDPYFRMPPRCHGKTETGWSRRDEMERVGSGFGAVLRREITLEQCKPASRQ